MTIITIRDAYFLSYFKIKGFKIIRVQSNKQKVQVAKKCHRAVAMGVHS